MQRGVSFWLVCLTSACNLSIDSKGLARIDAPAGACGTPKNVTVTPVYSEHTAWNDYVRMSDTALPRHGQPNTSCTGIEAGNYDACIHGGELRQARVTGVASCVGITARDTLGAFTWACDEVDGGVIVRSLGLRDDASLTALIEGTRFRDIGLEISHAECLIARAEPSLWWSNPVYELPDNPIDPVRLDEAGAIYVLPTSRATAGYEIAAPHVGLVTLGDAVLSPVPEGPSCSAEQTFPAVLCSDAQEFAWVEGRFDNNGTYGLLLSNMRFARVNAVRSINFAQRGVDVSGSRASLLTNIAVGRETAVGAYGIAIIGNDLLLRRARASQARTGVFVTGLRHVLRDVTTSNNNDGITIEFTSDTTATGLVSTHNWNEGIRLKGTSRTTLGFITAAANHKGLSICNTSNQTRAFNIVVAGNNTGLELCTSDDVSLRHVVASANVDYGITADADSSNMSFSGLLGIGDNLVADCLVDAAATNVTLDDDCRYGEGLADTAQLLDLSNSFVGKVLQNDTVNTVDEGGLWTFADSVESDWVGFEHQLRAWGREATFPGADAVMPCWSQTGVCRIWDWRLAHDDTTLRDVFGEVVGGASCPDAVQPTNALATMTDALTIPNTFWVGARELSGDGDGLCEEGEACVFAPNLGAAQGEGELGAPCTSASGMNVVMTAYE